MRAGTHFDLGIPAPVVRQLIGIGPDRFGQMVVELEPIWEARRQERLRPLGTRKRRKPGGGRPPIPFAVRLMATLIDMRWAPPKQTTADLLGISRDAVRRASEELRDLLMERGVVDERRLHPAYDFGELASASSTGQLAVRLSERFESAPWDH